MAITICSFAFALVSVSCAGHVRQVQASTQQLHGNRSTARDHNTQRSIEHESAKSRSLSPAALTKLLLAFIPAAALRSSELRAFSHAGAGNRVRTRTALASEDASLRLIGASSAGMARPAYNASKVAQRPKRQVRSPARAIKGFYAAFNTRDLERVGSYLTDDCVYEDLLFGPATICRGKQAFMNALQFHPAFVSSNIFSQLPFADLLPSLTLEVDSIAEGTDTVGVEWHVQCGRFSFPLGRGLSHAQFCPCTGKIKRVVDIAEAPWRVVGLVALPFINLFRVVSKSVEQVSDTAQYDFSASKEQQSQVTERVNYETALLKGTEELTGDVIVQLEILDAAISSLGPDHPAALWGKNNLANTLQARGDLDDAEALQREVLEARMSTFGLEHPDTLWTKHNLANTLRARGDLQAAESLQREVLEARIRTLGPDHPSTIAIKDNLELTVEEFRVAETEYINADVDGSGELDVDEFRTFARKLGILDASEADGIFKDVDTNDNGTIDLKEFTAWYSTSPWCRKAEASTV